MMFYNGGVSSFLCIFCLSTVLFCGYHGAFFEHFVVTWKSGKPITNYNFTLSKCIYSMELRSDFTSFYIVFPLVNYYCCVLTTFVLSFMYSGTSRLTLQHHCILCSPSSLPLMVRFMLPYAAFLWYFFNFDLKSPFSSSTKTGWWLASFLFLGKVIIW